MNIESLFSEYIDTNVKYSKEKDRLLEDFKSVESDFKHYEDVLSYLEKEKEKSKIDSFDALSKNVIDNLKNFDPREINANIYPVQLMTYHIEEQRDDLSAISKKFKTTETMWDSFLERNTTLDLSSVFVKNIIDKIKQTKEKFTTTEVDELNRLDEDIIDLNSSIVRSISMIETLNTLLEKNDFIGKEPQELKKEIEVFIATEYKKMTLVEINKKYTVVEDKINLYKKEVSLKRIKAKVIKIMNKENKTIYNYGIELNGFLIHVSEKISEKEILEDTKEYVYIDNFPIYGIVPVQTITEKIEVCDDQFFANKELNDRSFKLFIISIVVSGFFLLLTIFNDVSPFITLPIVATISGIFVFLFKGLKYSINSKYDLKDMFYFMKVSYLFVRVGDNGLNITRIIPGILSNFTKVVSHNVSKNHEEEGGV